MYCFVRRTLTTKSERKYFNNAHNFLHPIGGVMSLKEVIKYPNVIARVQLKNQTGVNDVISSLVGTKQSIPVIARAKTEAIRKVY